MNKEQKELLRKIIEAIKSGVSIYNLVDYIESNKERGINECDNCR